MCILLSLAGCVCALFNINVCGNLPTPRNWRQLLVLLQNPERYHDNGPGKIFQLSAGYVSFSKRALCVCVSYLFCYLKYSTKYIRLENFMPSEYSAQKQEYKKKQHHNEAYYQQQQQHKWDERASKRTNEKEIGKMLLSMSPRTTRVFHGFSIDVCMLFFFSLTFSFCSSKQFNLDSTHTWSSMRGESHR